MSRAPYRALELECPAAAHPALRVKLFPLPRLGFIGSALAPIGDSRTARAEVEDRQRPTRCPSRRLRGRPRGSLGRGRNPGPVRRTARESRGAPPLPRVQVDLSAAEKVGQGRPGFPRSGLLPNTRFLKHPASTRHWQAWGRERGPSRGVGPLLQPPPAGRTRDREGGHARPVLTTEQVPGRFFRLCGSRAQGGDREPWMGRVAGGSTGHVRRASVL